MRYKTKKVEIMKLMSASMLATFIYAGAQKMSAQSEDQWPLQPPLSQTNKFLGPISSPPYRIGTIILLESPALFIKRRSALDAYRKTPASSNGLIEAGLIVRLPTGHRLKARELITTFEGQVADDQLGNGYVIMTRSF